MKRTIFLSLHIIALLLISQIEVSACSCPDDPDLTIEQKVKLNLTNAKTVFSGEVIEVVKKFSGLDAFVKIKVEELWKGYLPKEVVIDTELANGATCGYDFEVGKKFLVFAYGLNNSNLTTKACDLNRRIEKATEELKILGKGKKSQKRNS